GSPSFETKASIARVGAAVGPSPLHRPLSDTGSVSPDADDGAGSRDVGEAGDASGVGAPVPSCRPHAAPARAAASTMLPKRATGMPTTMRRYAGGARMIPGRVWLPDFE